MPYYERLDLKANDIILILIDKEYYHVGYLVKYEKPYLWYERITLDHKKHEVKVCVPIEFKKLFPQGIE